jgi:hypothetical protein
VQDKHGNEVKNPEFIPKRTNGVLLRHEKRKVLAEQFLGPKPKRKICVVCRLDFEWDIIHRNRDSSDCSRGNLVYVPVTFWRHEFDCVKWLMERPAKSSRTRMYG